VDITHAKLCYIPLFFGKLSRTSKEVVNSLWKDLGSLPSTLPDIKAVPENGRNLASSMTGAGLTLRRVTCGLLRLLLQDERCDSYVTSYISFTHDVVIKFSKQGGNLISNTTAQANNT